MTSGDGRTPARGRPPVPSLASEAVVILERNAFSALRGPNSRGAVPRSAFDGIDVSTVDRSVKREFGGDTGRTPFDLASRRVSSPEGGTTATMESVFELVDRVSATPTPSRRPSGSSSGRILRWPARKKGSLPPSSCRPLPVPISKAVMRTRPNRLRRPRKLSICGGRSTLRCIHPL